jgi:hypothetical protein
MRFRYKKIANIPLGRLAGLKGKLKVTFKAFSSKGYNREEILPIPKE